MDQLKKNYKERKNIKIPYKTKGEARFWKRGTRENFGECPKSVLAGWSLAFSFLEDKGNCSESKFLFD